MSVKKYLQERIFSRLQGRMRPIRERGLQMEPLEDRNLLTATPNGWDIVDTPEANVEYGYVSDVGNPSEVKLTFGQTAGTDDLLVGVVVSGKAGEPSVLDPAAITLDDQVTGWQIIKSGMLTDAGGTNSSFVILRVTPNEEGYKLYISGKDEGLTGAFTCSVFTPGSANHNGVIDDFEIQDTFKFVSYTNAYFSGGRNPASIDIYRHMFGEDVDISQWSNVYSTVYDVNMDGVMTSDDLSLIKLGIRDTSSVKLEYDSDAPEIDPAWTDPDNPMVVNDPAEFNIPVIDDTGVGIATVKVGDDVYDAVLEDGGTTPEGQRITNIVGVFVEGQPVSFEDFFRDDRTGELNNGDYPMTVTATDNAGNEMPPTDVFVRYIAGNARETAKNETTYDPAWSFGDGAAITSLTIYEGNSVTDWDGTSDTIVLPSGAIVDLVLDGEGRITSMTYRMNGRWDKAVNLPEGDIDPVWFSMTNIGGESAAWDFNVLGVNDAPEAHASVQIALIDTTVSAAEKTNTTDRDRGDVLSSAVNSVGAPTFQDAPEGIEAIVPVGTDFSSWLTFDSASGEYVFEVPEGVDFLKQLPIGAKFILTYTCTVTDKLGATTEETVAVTVTGTNQAPVAEAIDQTYTAVPDSAAAIVLAVPCGGEDIDYSDTVALAAVTIGGTTYVIDWEAGEFAPGKSSVEVAGYGTYTLDTANKALLYTLSDGYSEQLRWTTPAGGTEAIELGGLEYQMADNHGAMSNSAAVSYTYVGAFDKLQLVNIPDQEVNALGTETGWKTLDGKVTFHSDAGQTYVFCVKEIKNDEHTLDAASLLRFADPVYGRDGWVELQVNRDALATIPAEWYGDYTVTFDYANTDTDAHADDAGQRTFTLSIVGYTITVTPAVIEGGTLTEDQVYTPETGYQAAVDLTTKIVSVTAQKSGGEVATVDSYDFSTTLRLDDVAGAGAADLTDAEKAHLLSCATIDSAGNFLFRLDTAASEILQYLAEGDSLTLSFGYSLTNLVIDGEAISGTLRGGDVTVMITGVNDAPVAHGTVDIALSDVDTAASASSKVTDADTPASELVYTLNSCPSGEDVVFSGNAPEGIAAIVDGADFSTWLTWDAARQEYVFTPGSEIFKALPETVTATLAYSFQVSDGKGGTTIEDIQVTITGTNQAPTAQDISVSVDAGDSVVIDWRANSNDVDFKDPVTLVKINDVAVTATQTNPQVIDLYDNDQYVGYLTVSIVGGEQVLIYTAAGDALKWDLAKGDTRLVGFTYQVSDGRLTSDTADAAVEVVGRFDPLEMDPENPTTLKITNKSPAVEGWIPATERLGFFSDALPGSGRQAYEFTVTKANDDTDLAQYFKMEATGGKVTLFVKQDAVTGPSPILPPGDYVLAFTSENLDGEADVQDHTINLTIQDKSGVEAAAIDLPAITEDVALISKDLSENTFIDPDKATATVTDVRFKTLGELPVHTVALSDSTGTYTGEQIKDHLGWTADRYTAFIQQLSEAASVDGASKMFTFSNDGTFLSFLADGAELHVTYHYTIDGYTSDGVVWDVPSTNNPITVNITGINDAPYGAADHTASVDLTTGAVVYDTGSATLNIFDGVVDPEGRSLSTTWIVPATVTAYGTTFTLSEGAVTVAADGTVSVDVDKLTGDFVKLGLGQSAEIAVKFTISDDQGLVVAEGERSLTVTVLGKNEAPTKKADAPTGSANIEESTASAPVSITPAMFAEDIDLNDTTLYFQSVTVEGTTITAQTAGWSGNTFTQAFASGATLTLVKNASGITSCSYNVAGRAERVPNLPAGQTAADSISFVVCDKAGAVTESIAYDFNVIGVNDAPYGANDHTADVNLINQTVKYDTDKDILNILDGVVDPDGNALSVANVSVPTSVTAYGHTFTISPGAISVASTGEVSIDLAALTSDFLKLAQDDTVAIPVTFLVKDSAGASVKEGIKTLTVTVVGKNDAPVASTTLTGTVDLAAGTQTALDLTSGAEDPDIDDYAQTAAVSSITYEDGGTVKDLPADCWSLTDSKTVVFDIAKLRALFPKLAIGSTVSLAVNFTVADTHGLDSDAATAAVAVEGWYEAPRFVTAYTVQTTHFAYADGSYDGILTLPLSGHFTGAYIAENTTAAIYSTSQGVSKLADLAYATEWTDVSWNDGAAHFVGQYRMVTDSSGNTSIELKTADYASTLNTAPVYAQITVSDGTNSVSSNLFQVKLADEEQCTANLILYGTNTATTANLNGRTADYEKLETTDVDTLGNYDAVNDNYWYYLEVWFRDTNGKFSGEDFRLTMVSFQLNHNSSNIESIHIWDEDETGLIGVNPIFGMHSDMYDDGQINVNGAEDYDLGARLRDVSLSSTGGFNVKDGSQAYLVCRMKVVVKAATSQSGTKCMADHSITIGAVTKQYPSQNITPFKEGLNLVPRGETLDTKLNDTQIRLNQGVVVPQRVVGLSGIEVIADNGVYLRTVAQATDESRVDSTLVSNTEYLHEWQSHFTEIWVKASELETYLGASAQFSYTPGYFTAASVEFGSMFSDGLYSIDADNGLITVSALAADGGIAGTGLVLLARVAWQSGEGDTVAWSATADPIALSWELTAADLHTLSGNTEVSVGLKQTVELWANPYDTDDDGAITDADLAKFLVAYGHGIAGNSYKVGSDYDRDGSIDDADLLYFLSLYGATKEDVVSGNRSILLPETFTQRYVGMTLSTDQIALVGTVYDAANQAWVEALGLDESVSVTLAVKDFADSETLAQAQVTQVDVNGVIKSGIIYIDDDAAGKLWYSQLSDPVDASRYDLYTVILHELGHFYGFDPTSAAYMTVMTTFDYLNAEGHSDDIADVMYYGVEVGQRKELTEQDIAAARAILDTLTGGDAGGSTAGAVNSMTAICVDTPLCEAMAASKIEVGPAAASEDHSVYFLDTRLAQSLADSGLAIGNLRRYDESALEARHSAAVDELMAAQSFSQIVESDDEYDFALGEGSESQSDEEGFFAGDGLEEDLL